MKNGSYEITLLEYAVQKNFSNVCVFNGYYKNDECSDVTYTIAVLKSENKTILIDTGYDASVAELKELADGCHITGYHSPLEVLKKIGVSAEDVTDIILTHAHWDHIGGIHLFPNAKFYIQKEEMTQWLCTLALPKEYETLNVSMSYWAMENLVALIKEKRLCLLNGAVDHLLPGIHVRKALMGHSFSSNIVIVDTPDRPLVFAGDVAYVKRNILGGDMDGVSLPNGFGVGSIYNAIQSMQDVLAYAGGNINNVVIGHEPDTWEQFRSVETEDGLHIAYVD